MRTIRMEEDIMAGVLIQFDLFSAIAAYPQR